MTEMLTQPQASISLSTDTPVSPQQYHSWQTWARHLEQIGISNSVLISGAIYWCPGVT